MKNILIMILSLLALTSSGQDHIFQPASPIAGAPASCAAAPVAGTQASPHIARVQVSSVAGIPASPDGIIQFVLTSDVHYGIIRKHFRHADSVASTVVNKAMIAAINRLPVETLPGDSGLAADRRVGVIDALLITGDIANREENGVQPAATSWAQFQEDYAGLTTRGRNGQPSEIWLTPGNHDVSKMPLAIAGRWRRHRMPPLWQVSITG